MHIHYNTNQTTLPLEISSFLPQDHLVFTIEKVVNTLEDHHFHAFYHAFGRPSYSHLVLKKHSKHSKIFGTSLNKSVTFFFKTAQACSMGFKSGE